MQHSYRHNSDEQLRKLERLAASGDPTAVAQYIHAYHRHTGKDHPHVSDIAANVGIDYSGAIGAQQSINRDESGIRYGIISVNALEHIWDIVEDTYEANCPNCGHELGDDIPEECPECEEELNEDMCWSDEPSSRTINHEGVEGGVDSHFDVWISKSPYYMRGTYCSPCAPGAVSIGSPTLDGPIAYCPPHDWYHEGEAPNLIFRVEDNTIVYPDDPDPKPEPPSDLMVYRRNADLEHPTKEKYSAKERAYLKTYRFIGRFLNALSVATLHEVADTWIDPGLKKVRSKKKLIDALLQWGNLDNELITSAYNTRGRDKSPILVTLEYMATEEEIDNLLDVLGITKKATSSLTNRAIFEALRISPMSPLSEVGEIRAELIQQRKRAALRTARGVKSTKAAEARVTREKQEVRKRKEQQAAEEKDQQNRQKIERQEARERKAQQAAEQKAQQKIERQEARNKAHLQKEIQATREKREKEAAREKTKGKKLRRLSRTEARETKHLPKIIEFLVEALKADYFGTKISMKAYAAAKGYPYVGFTKLVKAYTAAGQKRAHALFSEWQIEYERPIYRKHVIRYLAEKEMRMAEGVLSRRQFIEENKLDPDAFNHFFKEFAHQTTVLDEARLLFRQLEDKRLAELRKGLTEKIDPARQAFDQLFIPKEKPTPKGPDLVILEKIAQKKLPTKRGLPVFSKDPRENNRKLEMWLEIAEDVMEVGLADPVVEKYEHEFNLPSALSREQRMRLIKMEMKKVLQQLDVFDPSKEYLTFTRLRNWKEKRDEKKAQKEIVKQPEIIAEPEIEEDEYDEAWLEAEIARDEAEARRYKTTEEEKNRRRDKGFVFSGELSRDAVESITAKGAIYDEGEWLLATREDIQNLAPQTTTPGLKGWQHTRKPRLLVGIGTADYTKSWMKRLFDLKTVDSPTKASNALITFKPDALMIYASSCGKKLKNAFTELSRTSSLPLIIFEKGFSDALPSAELQGVSWFIDAYKKRKIKSRLLHRWNPWNKRETYSGASPRKRHFNGPRQHARTKFYR